MDVAVLLREEVEESLALLKAAETNDAKVKAATDKLEHALKAARPGGLLTTSEAAHALGVRSVSTIKYWVKTGYLRGVKRNERTMIPASEIARIRDEDRVRMLRASEERQQAAEIPGDTEPITNEEKALLRVANGTRSLAAVATGRAAREERW